MEKQSLLIRSFFFVKVIENEKIKENGNIYLLLVRQFYCLGAPIACILFSQILTIFRRF